MKPSGLRVLIDLRYLKALLLLPAMISWHQGKSESPTLSLIGPQELIHQIGTEYIDPGATAIDNEGFAIDVIAGGRPISYQVDAPATIIRRNVGRHPAPYAITIESFLVPRLTSQGNHFS